MGALDVDQYGSCNEVTSKVHHGEPPAIDANAENVTTARKKPELVEHRRKEHVETLANEKNPEEIVDAVTRARRRATQHRRERAESEKAAAEARKQERFGRR